MKKMMINYVVLSMAKGLRNLQNMVAVTMQIGENVLVLN